MDWANLLQSLDWTKAIGFLFGVAGPGALGGLYLNWRKNKEEIKRLQAETQSIKVETDNKFDAIRTRLIDNLQEERDVSNKKVHDCFEEVAELEEKLAIMRTQKNIAEARNTTLEILLTDNGIPIPY